MENENLTEEETRFKPFLQNWRLGLTEARRQLADWRDRLGRGGLALLAPGWCRHCGRTGLAPRQALCGACHRSIRWISVACPRCGMPGGPEREAVDSRRQAASCADCRGRKLWFDAASCGAAYEGVIQSAVLQYKFSQDVTIRPLLCEALRRAAEPLMPVLIGAGGDAGAVVVPQHWWKQVARGRNPAEELASEVVSSILPGRGLALRRLLKKTRWTAAQMTLAEKQRRRNLKRAFRVPRHRRAPGLVVLFDDVLTTGTTASECARALKDAGAKRVLVVAAARAI